MKSNKIMNMIQAAINNRDTEDEIVKYQRQIILYERILRETIPDSQMFLDGEIIDKYTFEVIRQATEQEKEYFYGIRFAEMKLRNL